MLVWKIGMSPTVTFNTGSPDGEGGGGGGSGGGGGGGGGGTTMVSAALPLWPSLVAVMVAPPTASPLTIPPPFTPASNGALLAHVTVRPERMAPLTSLRVAVSCCVPPTDRLTLAGLSVTDATGAAEALVVPAATLESAPNTASTSSVPRCATSSNW